MKQTNYLQQGSIKVNGMLDMLAFFFPGNNAKGVNELLAHGLNPPRAHYSPEGEFLDMHGELVLLTHRPNPVLLRKYQDKVRGLELRLPQNGHRKAEREFGVYQIPEAEANTLYHECTLAYAKRLEGIE